MQQRLPVGYRFHPTDGELVGYFLRNRASLGTQFQEDSIAECPDFYGKTEPWVIWKSYGGPGLEEGDPLYFFAQRRKLSAAGIRFHRKVGSGTWSGQYPTKVLEGGKVIGLRRDFRYEGGLNSDQNNGWLLQEFEIDESDVTVLCSLRKNPNQKKKKESTTLAHKKRKQKCNGASEDDQSKAKRLRTCCSTATAPSPDSVVDLSDFDCNENTGSSLDRSLGGPASCLGVSSLSCVDPNLFDFSDNAIANALSLLQTHNSVVDSQVNPSIESLVSYSSLLSSPVIFDDILCDSTQSDDAGCSKIGNDDNLCGVTHNENAGSLLICQVNPSIESLVSYSSLLSSPVIFDDVLCDPTQSDDAGCSKIGNADNLCGVTHNENAGSSLGQSCNVLPDVDVDWDNILNYSGDDLQQSSTTITHNENAGSSLGQSSNVLPDGQDWSNQFEGGIGELDFSLEDVEDHYLLQSQVLDDDE